MKKQILLLVIAVGAAAIPSISAQTNGAERVKHMWIDLQAAQHIGLNQWSDAGYANDGFPSPSITELRATGNLIVFNPVLGIFLDMGLGVMPAPDMKSFDLGRMPMPNSGTQYYLREMLSETGANRTSVQCKIAAGVFANFRAAPKLNIMPYLGAGGITVPRRSYRMILKEEGSNNQYHAAFVWGTGEGNEDDYPPDSQMLGYLAGRLMFKYKVSLRSSLVFGLEYTHFLNTMNFDGKFSNTFNGNVQRSFSVEGNKMNMLGVSVGISFM